ncbi:ComEC/Rec2 family competence protein [Fluviicola chungangensis]|uniref:Metallo-beta-lactamase domain-containing protein n=1 Tax=Fluviicola chungangensis TaxID=2597671 RepID=A0A556MN89_9FLAO|nr:MBL fold metallo-hydrolase [Fluviicola chungangensis]TSJ41302.1 hypothetical protein FO442_15435 [Fluviicola chungangensis]
MRYSLEIIHLDVGQGDCSVLFVRDQNDHGKIVHTVVIDCGGARQYEDRNEESTESHRVLYDCLLKYGVEQINVIILSHYDKDHYMGITELMNIAAGTDTPPYLRNLFRETILYDQGFSLGLRYDGGEHPIIDNTSMTGINNLEFYYGIAKLLHQQPLYDINGNLLPAFDRNGRIIPQNVTNVMRACEFVFSGNPHRYKKGIETHDHLPNNIGGSISIQRGVLNQNVDSDEWGIYDEHEFQPCDYLLGRDLMVGPMINNPYGIGLECVIVNGHALTYDSDTDEINSTIAYQGVGDDNKFSIGLLLIMGEFTYWFGGDLEKEQERNCVSYIQHRANGQLSCMKAGHHGSSTSSDDYFLNTLKPTGVIISCGHHDSFNHPHLSVIEKLYHATYIQRVLMTSCHNIDVQNLDYIPARNSPFNPDFKFGIAGGTDIDNVDYLGHISVTAKYNGGVLNWDLQYFEQCIFLQEFLLRSESPEVPSILLAHAPSNAMEIVDHRGEFMIDNAHWSYDRIIIDSDDGTADNQQSFFYTGSTNFFSFKGSTNQ